MTLTATPLVEMTARLTAAPGSLLGGCSTYLTAGTHCLPVQCRPVALVLHLNGRTASVVVHGFPAVN